MFSVCLLYTYGYFMIEGVVCVCVFITSNKAITFATYHRCQ